MVFAVRRREGCVGFLLLLQLPCFPLPLDPCVNSHFCGLSCAVTDMLASILEAELKPPRIQEFPGDASPGDPMETSPTHPSHTSSSSPDASDEALDPSSSSVSEDSATMVGGAEEEDPFRPASLLDRGPAFRKKVLAVTRLLRMYRTLRQDHESILQLKQLTPDNQIPRGLLGKGSEEIQKGERHLVSHFLAFQCAFS